MPKAVFILTDLREHEIEVVRHESLMRAAVRNNVDGIAGECGGSLTCATCHVYVDPGWADRLPAPDDAEQSRQTQAPQVELTWNWDPEAYTGGRNFGHLAYAVDDIYAACQRLMDHGVTINRPPRDGRMAFVRSPELISIELLQAGTALAPAEPWASMPNVGVW